MKILSCLFLTAVLFSAAASAQVSCGSVLSSNAALTADLNCSSGFTALEITADDVTLDLNGFTLSGSILQGISVSSNRVTIQGPGSISGFDLGIQSLGTTRLQVNDVDFVAVAQPLILTGTRNALIRRNRFVDAIIGVEIRAFPDPAGSLAASGNRVLGNRFNRVDVGVNVCGYTATDQRIERNRFRNMSGFAVQLETGARDNSVISNRFFSITGTGVRLSNASNNLVQDNDFDSGRLALTLLDNNGNVSPLCVAPPVIGVVTGNRIENNNINGFDGGVTAGLGVLAQPRVIANRIGGNVISNTATGLFLQTDAWVNDATGNTFSGVADPVIDQGNGNSF